MDGTVINPPVPFVGPIPGGFSPGKMVRVKGYVPPNSNRFDINFLCGSNRDSSDIALHISVRISQRYIARNTRQFSKWEKEEGSGQLRISPDEQCEIIILCDRGQFKIAVNGQHFCEFHERISCSRISHLAIEGTVFIYMIAFESNLQSCQAQQTQFAGTPSAPHDAMGGYAPPLPVQGMPMPVPFPPLPHSTVPMPSPGMPMPHAPSASPYPQVPPAPHSTAYPTQPSPHLLSYPTPGLQIPHLTSYPGSNPHSSYPGLYPAGTIPPLPPGHLHGSSGNPLSKIGNFMAPTAAAAAMYAGGKKLKKSKLKKAMKYGLPIAGVGVGAYALSKAFKHSSSSSSSSSSSDSD